MNDDAAAVADVVQETFMGAARSARGFNPARGSLWVWLWGIARNQVALHYRKQATSERLVHARRWWASLDGDKVEWLAAECDAPPEILASRELADLVRAALAELPADYQLLLTSRYVDGSTAEQIALEISSTGGAVRSRLVRARRAFRQAFAGMVDSSDTTGGEQR
jgi:RNA polymerase sigma-70 factor (ECF subfamily)